MASNRPLSTLELLGLFRSDISYTLKRGDKEYTGVIDLNGSNSAVVLKCTVSVAVGGTFVLHLVEITEDDLPYISPKPLQSTKRAEAQN